MSPDLVFQMLFAAAGVGLAAGSVTTCMVVTVVFLWPVLSHLRDIRSELNDLRWTVADTHRMKDKTSNDVVGHDAAKPAISNTPTVLRASGRT
jgi:type II secretory pathway component PulM